MEWMRSAILMVSMFYTVMTINDTSGNKSTFDGLYNDVEKRVKGRKHQLSFSYGTEFNTFGDVFIYSMLTLRHYATRFHIFTRWNKEISFCITGTLFACHCCHFKDQCLQVIIIYYSVGLLITSVPFCADAVTSLPSDKCLQIIVYMAYIYKNASMLAELKVSNESSVVYRLQREIPDHNGDKINFKGIISFQSGYKYSVQVLYTSDNFGNAGLILLPIDAWAKHYSVVTLYSNPFIVITSLQLANVVKIKFRYSSPSVKGFKYQNEYFPDESTLRVKMSNFEAFIISFCEDSVDFSMTGTSIEALLQISVISGSCVDLRKFQGCPVKSSGDGYYLAADTMLPKSLTGTDYFIPSLPVSQYSMKIVAVGLEPNTDIRIYQDLITLKIPMEPKYFEYHPNDKERAQFGYMRVQSKKPIYLALLIYQNCTVESHQKFGFPGIAMLVPSTALADQCHWRNPRITWAIDEYIAIQTSKKNWNQMTFHVDRIKYFNKTAPSMIVDLDSDHQEFHYKLLVDEIIVSAPESFACYAYGLGVGLHINVAEFKFRGVLTEECTKSSPKNSDEKDNDCDGRIDEEKLNKMDDDGDTLCDEDYGTSEMDDSFVNYIWGENCSNKCLGCQGGCDPIDGYCSICIAGYKGPSSGCQAPCDAGQYGINCLGKCQEKCGSDCKDKATGKCEDASVNVELIVYFVMIAAIIIGFVVITTLAISSSRREPIPQKSEETSVMATKQESEVSKRVADSEFADRNIPSSPIN